MEKTTTPAGHLVPPVVSFPPPPARRGWLKGLAAVLGGLLLSRTAAARPASPRQVESEQPYIGEIQLFAFGLTPRFWLPCEGQLLAINQNAALFSILGTTYGGNGTTTFALPDLRGRTPRGVGSGYVLGQSGGTESATLSAAQLPAHSHGYQVSSAAATSNVPAGTVAAVASATNDLNGEAVRLLAYAGSPNATAAASAVAATGSTPPAAVGIVAPCTALNFCIAVSGIFPSRN